MNLSEGLKTVLQKVAELEPTRYTELEPALHPMCERNVGNHLKRLQTRQLIAYNLGIYTVTQAGRAVLGNE